MAQPVEQFPVQTARHRYAADAASLLEPIRRLHDQIRSAVVQASEDADRRQSAALAGIAEGGDAEAGGDTIYEIDKISEALLIDFFEREVAPHAPLILIAEGLPGGKANLPRDAAEEDAVWRVIMDPIDGTRGIMYQKRAAWILTGVAPNRGPGTRLRDIELAVQTELPLVKQHLCDVLWAVRGRGAQAERVNRLTGGVAPLQVRPSRERTIAHGYETVVRFFPGAREELAAIDEEIVRGALGPVQPGKAHCFEDQYACTGGQLYELACGHDRFIADLRPLMDAKLRQRGQALGLCCHPYDLCTELIARELGVIVTDETGAGLNPLLSVDQDVSWVGYANGGIRTQIEPLLQKALAERRLLPAGAGQEASA